MANQFVDIFLYFFGIFFYYFLANNLKSFMKITGTLK